MDTTLDNPVIKGDDIDQKFLEAAALADKGQDIPADLVPGANKYESPADTDKEQVSQPDNSETDPEKEKVKERPRDELGRFTKTESGEDIPEDKRQPAEVQKEPAKTDPAPSEYEAKKQERQKKEQERLDKTWENVNQRKDELARERAEIERARQELQQRASQPPPTKLPYSSQELFQASEHYEAEALKALNAGDYDKHGENLTLARDAREQGKRLYQLEAEQSEKQRRAEFDREWNANAQPVLKEHPELLKADSPLAQGVAQLFKDNPFLSYLTDGLPKAVEVVKLRMEAGSASKLREANKTLKAELDELRQKTSISGGGVTASRPAAKKFADMTPAEQEAHLMQQAAMIDAGQ